MLRSLQKKKKPEAKKLPAPKKAKSKASTKPKTSKKKAKNEPIKLLEAPKPKFTLSAPTIIFKEPKKVEKAKPKETLNINDYSLNKKLIEQTNNNSMMGSRGSFTEGAYKGYVNEIMASKLSDSQKSKLIMKLQKLFNESLSLDSRYVPWTVSGPARYPQQKMNAIVDRIFDKNNEIINYWEKVVEPAISRAEEMNRTKEEKDLIQQKNELKSLNNFKNNINTAVEWKEKYGSYNNMELWYAERQMLEAYNKGNLKLFKQMFEELNKYKQYRKNTNVYKLYKKIVDGEITSESIEKRNYEANKTLYKCDEYVISNLKIDAGQRVIIKFFVYPKPQLVYALKRRGYHWYSYDGGGFITKPEKFDLDWAKSIKDNYEKYLQEVI